MNKAITVFYQWANKYRDFLSAEFFTPAHRPELDHAFSDFLNTLPEVLRPLAVEFELRGFDSTPVWDAIGNPYMDIRELEKTLDRIWALVKRLELKESEGKPAKSRVQPDHPITKWVRQHGKGRKDSEAVRAYIELHKDSNPKNPKAYDYDKLYQDLQNDKKKHRKHQSD